MKPLQINSFSKVLAALTMVLFMSCSKQDSTDHQLSGKLHLNVGISVATYDVYNHLKAANLNSFLISIYNQQDELVEQFTGVNQIPESIELSEGIYYVTAHSNNNLPAEFDNDYYYGHSNDISIVAGQTSSATITCVLSNIMITIIYSENVMRDFSDYSTTVSNTASSLVFEMNETRAGYFDEGPLHIESNLQYQDNTGNIQIINLTGDITNAEAGKHYEIHIDATLTEGTAIVNVNVDESYETEIVLINDEEAEMSGELLITEIMYNPSALSDTEGEYIEIKNVSDANVSLRDLVIRRGSNNDIHVISDDIVLLPDETAALGRSGQSSTAIDYVYSTISLLNGGDEIYINNYGTNGTDGSVICMVDYGASGFITSLNGSSIQLDPSISNVYDAQLGSNWCESTISFSTGDRGSPGTENANCE